MLRSSGVSVRRGCEHVFAMTYPPYLREKARKLRVDKQLTIDEIAARLAVSRTTAFYWVGDIPIPRPGGANGWPDSARRKGNRAMQQKYRVGLSLKANKCWIDPESKAPEPPDVLRILIRVVLEYRQRHVSSVASPGLDGSAAGWLVRLDLRGVAQPGQSARPGSGRHGGSNPPTPTRLGRTPWPSARTSSSPTR